MTETKTKITKGHLGIGGVATIVVALLSAPGTVAWLQKGDEAGVAYEVLAKEIEHLREDNEMMREDDRALLQAIQQLRQNIMLMYALRGGSMYGLGGSGALPSAPLSDDPLMGLGGVGGIGIWGGGGGALGGGLGDLLGVEGAEEWEEPELVLPEPPAAPESPPELKPLEDLLSAPKKSPKKLPGKLEDLMQ